MDTNGCFTNVKRKVLQFVKKMSDSYGLVWTLKVVYSGEGNVYIGYCAVKKCIANKYSKILIVCLSVCLFSMHVAIILPTLP